MAQSSARPVIAEVWLLSQDRWYKLYEYRTDRGLIKRMGNIARFSPSLKVLIHYPLSGRWYPVEFGKDSKNYWWETSRSLGQTSVNNLALKGVNC